MADTRAAYRRCEEITWSQARNFSYGIRLLPPPKRRALAAVYAFARRIDDIGDGELPAAEKLSGLAGVRETLAGVMAGRPDPADPVQVALAGAGTRFPLPLAAFGELIDGCEADVRGTSYTTFDELLHYCRCVAGSIGRLSLGVFGSPDQEAAAPLADALGVALQLTNILRDITEDYRNGRVYLPAEDLRRFGVSPGQWASLPGAGPGSNGNGAGGKDGGAGAGGSGASVSGAGSGVSGDGASGSGDGAAGRLNQLVAFEAERARGWYDTGLRLMPMLDRRSAACTGAMAGIYFRLLQHIAASPATVFRQRVSLSAGEKARVAALSLAGAARPGRAARAGVAR